MHLSELFEEVDFYQLSQVESFIESLWDRLNIDVKFTRHFLDRLNDPRNGKPITVAELIRLFKKEYERNGKDIAKLDDIEAVMKDLLTNINLPFVIKDTPAGKELVAKTIMRKPNFKTPDPEFIVQEKETYQPPSLDVGDEVKVGKFKNRKAEIKGFKKDENNQPVLKTTKGDQKLFKPRISKLMKESPLADYQPLGDFSKPGPFTGVDKKLVPHQVNQLKAAKFLENTQYDFRLFFSNLPGTGKYSEHGPMKPDIVQAVFGEQSTQILANSQNAITVVFVGNKGDAKVMLTPWMMAHRFGHAIQAGVRKQNRMTPLRGSGTSAHDGGWPDAEQYFFRTVNNMLENYYGKLPKFTQPDGMDYNLVAEYNALFNAMGTQRSSRSNKIKRPYEFLYELFAQYLKDGRITLNPMPVNLGYGRQAWGNPSKYMNLKPEYRDEDTRQSEALALGDSLSEYFAEVLRRCVGNIYVM